MISTAKQYTAIPRLLNADRDTRVRDECRRSSGTPAAVRLPRRSTCILPVQFLDIAVSYAVRSLLDRILLAVRKASRALDARLGRFDRTTAEYRDKLITTSVFPNAAVAAFDLQREIRAQTDADLAVACSVYDVSRTRVSAIPFCDGDAEPPAILPAPASADALADLMTRIVDRVV